MVRRTPTTGSAAALEAVEQHVEAELELGLVVAPADGGVGAFVRDLGQHRPQVGERPAIAAISASDMSAASPPLPGSKSSWLKPIARLPSACSVWWARS